MSHYLADTHVMLWVFDNNPTLFADTREAMMQADRVYASHTSVWEIVIKKALGKLSAPDDLQQAIEKTGLVQLPITISHILYSTKPSSL